MPPTIPLIDRKPITYDSAIDEEENFLTKASYVAAVREFYAQLAREHDAIVSVVRHHLNLGPPHTSTVVVVPEKHWYRGSFNVCVPVIVIGPASGSGAASGRRKLLIRFPLPFKLAEARYRGTIDEKVGCEVGAYAWMQEHCKDVRIPHLYGFGFSEHRQGAQFTHVSQRPLYIRAWQAVRRFAYRILGYPMLSHYAPHAAASDGRLSTAYVLLEFIRPSTGQMLSNTWSEKREDPERRQRLFRGLSRIMLSLARVPQPRIGSFQFRDDGLVTLTTCPLTTTVMILENDNTTRTISQDQTFESADTYASGMLSFHDARFLSHPNAAYDADDCRGQMSARVLLRALQHRFTHPARRPEHFRLQLTDLHGSNILVDEDWNAKCLIDLEWICALPTAMLDVPYWLTGRGIDQITDEQLAEFDKMRRDFMSIFEQEEREADGNNRLSQSMHTTWDSSAVWFWHSISSVNAMFSLVNEHFCVSGYTSIYLSQVTNVLFNFWCDNAEAVVEKKVAQYHEYADQLKRLFPEEKDSAVEQTGSLSRNTR